MSSPIKVFATCPQSREVEASAYPAAVAAAARWSEAAGCEGILVYSDNGILDPWLVSQLVVQATERLSPLVAVQPAYMHPYAVAKMVASLVHLHGRRTHLNLVAGGFRNDLQALGDDTEHDRRYARLVEYGRIVAALTGGEGPATMEGDHYRVHNLRLTPPLPDGLRPGLMVSGSSPAGLRAAQELGATAIKYPMAAEQEEPAAGPGLSLGIRVGIIVRDDRDEAWRLARERFPKSRPGQITHELAMSVSDSHWHRRLSQGAPARDGDEDPYWLEPFRNYGTFCPYLVGDRERVAGELRRYIGLGFTTFVLDIPRCEEDMWQIAAAFALAQRAPEV